MNKNKLFKNIIYAGLVPVFLVLLLSFLSLIFQIKWGNVIGGFSLIIGFLASIISPILILIGLIGFFITRKK